MTESVVQRLFGVEKPIIGMIHLAGRHPNERIESALLELRLYDKLGVDGAIIEDYHGTPADVLDVLRESKSLNLKLTRGVNLLRNPYMGFALAQEHGAKFVQFDGVEAHNLDLDRYQKLRVEYPEIAVLGGVRFKYKNSGSNSLEYDLEDSRTRCEIIVTTGDGTGIETPIEKLKQFRQLTTHPVFVGAGVTADNILEQLKYCNGAIIGSYFKNGDTRAPLIRENIQLIVEKAKEARWNN